MSTIKDELVKSQQLLIQQRLMYVNIANELNQKQNRVLMGDQDNNALGQAVIMDISGQLASTYFGLNDLNISADQLARYMTNFSYESSEDPVADEVARKDGLSAVSADNIGISDQGLQALENQQKLFGKSIDRNQEGQKTARSQSSGIDALTGERHEGTRQEADHVMARSTVYTPDWLSKAGQKKIETLTDSQTNFQMINWKANRIKSDNRVYSDKNGNIIPVKYTEKQPDGTIDITATATPNQRNEAFIGSINKAVSDANDTIANSKNAQKVKAAQTTISELKKGNYLDEKGQLNKKISDQNLKNLHKMANAQDRIILADFGKNAMAHFQSAGAQVLMGHEVYERDMLGRTKTDENNKPITKTNRKGEKVHRGGMKDLIIGQIIYYTLPPLLFEVRQGLKKGKSTDGVLKRLKKSVGRITKFIISKLRNIIMNITSGGLRAFVKQLLSTAIDVLAGTLKNVLTILRDFLMAIMSSIKILTNKKMSGVEKANAVMGLITTTTIGLIVNLLLDELPANLEILKIPIQIIVTALLSNLAMKWLEQLDLFNIKYGFNIAQLRQLYDDASGNLNIQLNENLRASEHRYDQVREELSKLEQQTMALKGINYYYDSAEETLNDINYQYDMQIDFDGEWEQFVFLGE